jgi:hypothetical protein
MQMRREINDKSVDLLEKVSAINLTMAKWVGGFAVLMFVGQVAMRKFIG